MRKRLRALYHSRPFILFLVAFDLGLVAFFVFLSFIDPPGGWIRPVDTVLAVVLGAELAARVWVSDRPLRAAGRLSSLADLIVVVSLLIPALTESYAFLRILRAVRLLRSYHLLGMLRERSAWVRANQEALLALVNLVVFMFFITAVVYVTQTRRNPEIADYVDALYFTVTTLTTTGFGDITLDGPGGRLLSVLIMVFGISLFVRLAQALFRPRKVRFPCPVCGLNRHDPDAIHCKHCGTTLAIPNEGAD